MAMNDAELRFQASLDDEVTPKLDKLERKLRKAGATDAEIKMFLRAYDEATPKIKEAQRQVEALPKERIVYVRANTDHAHSQIGRLRAEADKPVRMKFEVIDNFKETLDKMFSLRSRAALPAGMPGSNLLTGVGIGGAGALGAVGGAAAFGAQSVAVNAKMEQSLVTLTQTLKDQSRATQEMGKLVQFASKTPFNYQDVLAADVRLRSYQIPTMKGEGGPNNKGWLDSAGNMAAAMNTPITQAVEAIADARQGYFVRMMSYGIRMMREDFEKGGKYAGMTYEQGLDKALKRFEGSMEMQSKTFTGIMSNLQDIFQNQIMRPIGAAPFEAIRSTAQSTMEKLQSPDFQRDMGEQIEKVQRGFISMYDKMQEGKQYFQENLQEPLMAIGQQLMNVGKEFTTTFGSTMADAIKTVGTALFGIAKPMVQLIDANPGLAKMVGLMKALSLLGFDFMKPLRDMGSSALRLNIMGMASAFARLTLTFTALRVAMITKDFMEASRASEALRKSFEDLGDKGLMKFEARLSRISGGLNVAQEDMKNFATAANNVLKDDGANAETRADRATLIARYAGNMSHRDGFDYKGGGVDAARLIASQANVNGDFSSRGIQRAADDVADLDAVAEKMGMKVKDLVNQMQIFNKEATPLGLMNPGGMRYLAAFSQGLQGAPLTSQQLAGGISTQTELTRRYLQEYQGPSIDTLRKLGGPGMRGLSRYWDARDTGPQQVYGSGSVSDPNPARSHLFGVVTDNAETAAANRSADRQAQRYINRYAPGFNLPKTPQPLAIPEDLMRKIQGTDNAGERMRLAASGASEMRKELDQINKELADANEKLNGYNNRMQQLSAVQDRVNLAMSDFQRMNLLPLQRQIEDAGIVVQEFANTRLRDLEHRMLSLNEAGQKLSHTMQNAQYDMAKYNSGLFEGEQAALDNLHAMERYNRALQMMQLQYQQIGDELGQTTYDQGARLRVEPMANISLAAQQERLSRRQRLAQLRYEDHYGEQRYKLQQAARLRNERTEMSFSDRLEGVRRNVGVIDSANDAQHRLANTQYSVQTSMNAANKEMRDQQEHIADLQLQMAKLNASPEFRGLQDAQASLQRKSQSLNIQIQKQNIEITKLTDQAEPLKDMYDAFQKYVVSLIDLDKTDPEKMIAKVRKFAQALGPELFGMDSAQIASVNKTMSGLEDAVRENTKAQKDGSFWNQVKSAFHFGDAWRRLGDQITAFTENRNMGNFIAIMGTAATVVATTLIGGGILGVLARQMVARIPAAALDQSRVVRAIRTTMVRRGESLAERSFPGAARVGEFVAETGRRGPFSRFARMMAGEGLGRELINVFRPFRRSRIAAAGMGARALSRLPVIGPFAGIAANIWGTRRAEDTTWRQIIRNIGDHTRQMNQNFDAVKLNIERGVRLGNVPDEMRASWKRVLGTERTARYEVDVAKKMEKAAQDNVDAAKREFGNVTMQDSYTKDQKKAAQQAIDAAESQAKSAREYRIAAQDGLREARRDAITTSKFIGAVNQSGKGFEDFSKTTMDYDKFHKIHNDRLSNITSRYGGMVRRMGGRITDFGAHVITFGGRTRRMGGASRRMVSAAIMFGTAIDTFKDISKAIDGVITRFSRAVMRMPGVREAESARRGVVAAERAAAARRVAESAVSEADPAERRKLFQRGADFLERHPALRKGLMATGALGDAAFVGAVGYGAAHGQGEDIALMSLGGASLVKSVAQAGGLRAVRGALSDAARSGGRGEVLKVASRLGLKGLGRLAGPIGTALLAKDAYDIMEGDIGFGTRELLNVAKRARATGDTHELEQLTPEQQSRALELITQQDYARNQRNVTIQGNLGGNERDVLKAFRDARDATEGMIAEMKRRGQNTEDMEKRLANINKSYHDERVKYGKKAGDQINKNEAERYQKSLEMMTDNMQLIALSQDKAIKHRNSREKRGFEEIWSTTDSYLDRIGKRYGRFRRNLGLTAGGGDSDTAPMNRPGDSGNPDAAPQTRRPDFAAGGFPNEHILRGAKDSKGYLIRVGEEDDEAIIPMAPHRRDRAKSLLSQIAGRLGGHGAGCDHCKAMATGGMIREAHGGQDRAYLTAKSVFARAMANGGFIEGKGHFAGPHGSLEGFVPLANFLKRKFNLGVTAGRTDHSKYTVDGNLSDHGWGGAVDFSNGTQPTPEMDAAHAWMKGHIGFMIKQMLYRTMVGGNHFNHIHVALNHGYAEDDETVAKVLAGTSRGLTASSLANLISTGGMQAGPRWPEVPKKLGDMGPTGRIVALAMRRMRNQAHRASGGIDNLLENFSGGGDARSNISLGQRMASALGWGRGNQWQSLYKLWMGESGWRADADNPTSDAYGIPQSLPGSKMSSAGADWHDNPATQIKWGLQYIKERYGSPARAYGAWLGRNPHWYAPGKNRIEEDNTPAILHAGERVLNAAQATKKDKDEDPVEERRKSRLHSIIEELRDDIRKIRQHMASVDDKTEKKKDKTDLAELNSEMRRRWAQINDPRKADASTARAARAAGDTSGGEGTLAEVRKIAQELKTETTKEIHKLEKTPAYKKAVKAANTAVRTAVSTRRRARSASSQGGTRVTKREHAAIRATSRAARSAKKVPALMRKKARQIARKRVVVRAVKRGTNVRAIQSALGKRKLTGRQARLASKAGKGGKGAAAALKALRASLTKEIGKTSKEIRSAQGKASRDQAAARRAMKAAGMEARGAGHRTAKASSDIAKHVRDQGNKGRSATKEVAREAKGGKDVSAKADAKRVRAEAAADKRERQHYNRVEKMLDQIAKRDLSVNIHNEAHGATLTSTTTKSNRRNR